MVVSVSYKLRLGGDTKAGVSIPYMVMHGMRAQAQSGGDVILSLAIIP